MRNQTMKCFFSFLSFFLLNLFISTQGLYAQTFLNPGDLLILGVNANTGGSPDEISFVCFKDITAGTEIQVTDQGYEYCAPGFWGSIEGGARLTRTGATIPAGTVITFKTNLIAFLFPDAAWTVADLDVAVLASNLNLNSGGDQIYFAQGGVWAANGACNNDYPGSSGRILFGFSTSGAWVSNGNSTKKSALYPSAACFSMAPTGSTDFNKYKGPLTAATQAIWIKRVSDPLNWSSYASSAAYFSASPDLHNRTIPITPGTVADWTAPAGALCSSDAAINLNLLVTGSPGGIWTGTGVTGNTFNPAGLNSTYDITYTVTTPCPISQTHSITVKATPVPPTVISPVSYCPNAAAVPLTATGTNLLWYAAAAGGAGSVAAPTPTTTTIGSTNYYVSQTNNGCESQRALITVTIKASIPLVTGFSYSAVSACANGSNPVLQPDPGFTTGGIFSATPAGLNIDPATGSINIAASTAGDYSITYTVAASGCNPAGTSVPYPFSVYINAVPVTGFNYLPNNVCANAANPTLNKNLGFNSGGVFSASSAGLVINPATGDINVATSTPGTYTVTYILAASGCTLAGTNTASFTINANTNPVTGFSYTPNIICANGNNPTLNTIAGFTIGGTYSSSPAGLNIDPVTGAVNVLTSTPFSYTITYSVAASGCSLAGSTAVPVTITANIAPVTGFSYTPNSICANGNNPTLNTVAGFTTGGIYSAASAGLSINAATGAVNVAASTAGLYTVTYTVAASGCTLGGSNTASFTINANSNPVTSFSYTPNIICTNGNNPTLNTVAGFTPGGNYSATPAGLSINPVTGAINAAASTTGNYTVTYVVAATGCTLAGSGTNPVTINSTVIPVTGFSYTPNIICANGNNPTLNTVAGFTTGGNYSSLPAGLNIDPVTGVVNVLTSTPGTYTITYSIAASGCTSAGSNTTSVTISSTINPITGFSYTPNTICTNGNNPTLNTVAGFTTGGIYSAASAGLSINAGTGAVNVAASTAGLYTVTYTVAASGCTLGGSNTASFTINANSNPVTGFSYTPNTVCANGNNPTQNTAAGFTAGGIYTFIPAGLSLNGNTGAVNIAASTPGTYTVSYNIPVTGCTLASSGSTTITINPTINAVTGFSYMPNIICTNGNNPTLNTVAGFTTGGNYLASPAGLNINPVTGAINIAASTAGIYTVTYAVAASGCRPALSSAVNFVISNIPPPAVTQFSYNSPVCTVDADPVPVTTSGFTSGGTFSSAAGLSININTGIINAAASIPGNYTIIYTIAATACSVVQSGTANIMINNTPAIPVVADAGICGPGIVTLAATGTSGTVNWYSDQALTNLVNTGNIYSPSLIISATYFVTAANGTCVSSPAQVVANINPIPEDPLPGNDTAICSGDRLTLDAGAYQSYLWQDGSTNRIFIITNPGIYSVQVSTAAGCTNSGSISITPSADCSDIYFPTSFTPNGDNRNETFGPLPLSSLSSVKKYSLVVYNRYGQIVFSTNDPYQKWDGNIKGKKSGINNFVWFSSYLFRNRFVKKQKGNLILLR